MEDFQPVLIPFVLWSVLLCALQIVSEAALMLSGSDIHLANPANIDSGIFYEGIRALLSYVSCPLFECHVLKAQDLLDREHLAVKSYRNIQDPAFPICFCKDKLWRFTLGTDLTFFY